MRWRSAAIDCGHLVHHHFGIRTKPARRPSREQAYPKMVKPVSSDEIGQSTALACDWLKRSD